MRDEEGRSEDDVHGYCSDCGRQMSDSWMERNPLANAGQSPSCPTCGGVVIVAYAQDAANEIKRQQRDRGIPG